MNIYYDKDIDYGEIFFKKCENYGEDIGGGIVIFKSEETNEIVGFSFEEASSTVFESKDLPTRAKVAFLLKMTREGRGYTQEQIVKKLNHFSGRQYQRAEAGENITLDFIDEVRNALPEADFSKVFPNKINKTG